MTARQTLIVELYAGPSSGKSTYAAVLYAQLKEAQISVELAREYVKRWAWEGRAIGSFDEYYVLGKQIHEESSLLGKVAVVVTDRPVLLSTIYASLYAPARIAQGIRQAVFSYYDAVAEAGHRRIAVRMKRRRDYDPCGRFEDANQAAVVDGVVDTELGEMLAMSDLHAGIARWVPSLNLHPHFIGLYSDLATGHLIEDIIALTKS
ncbi:MAG: hypothetical protein E6Q97_23005 [Desulfurellales bacterium]|nr:MAG: hypothetical protein E6Q97_23005 [Desulfurellales bacterium]